MLLSNMMCIGVFLLLLDSRMNVFMLFQGYCQTPHVHSRECKG